MKTSRWFILLSLVSVSGFSALAPYYASVRELEAILKNEEVAAKLSGSGPITTILREGKNVSVATPKCAVTVAVSYATPSGFVGPGQILLSVGEVNCLP